jgi:hypothetical protein
MKSSITANLRPLLRAFYPFVIGIAVLWAVPRNAHAQLYVTQSGDSVGEYNTTTGEVINASFITGLDLPIGLALRGNTLFVVNFGPGTVGEYDAKTGATINASFITGLNNPEGLALLGDTLFVSNFGNGTVGEYDANTGAAINTNFIAGLARPIGLALRGNTLFVVNFGSSTVGARTALCHQPTFVPFIHWGRGQI